MELIGTGKSTYRRPSIPRLGSRARRTSPWFIEGSYVAISGARVGGSSVLISTDQGTGFAVIVLFFVLCRLSCSPVGSLGVATTAIVFLCEENLLLCLFCKEVFGVHDGRRSCALAYSVGRGITRRVVVCSCYRPIESVPRWVPRMKITRCERDGGAIL